MTRDDSIRSAQTADIYATAARRMIRNILRLLTSLQNCGLKVFSTRRCSWIFPKPWRIADGSALPVSAHSSTKFYGYNAFISHYANLVAGKVDDTFAIGTEMWGPDEDHEQHRCVSRH